jgi:outer membrane protein OmpA-like peptidoglycan-associated protein
MERQPVAKGKKAPSGNNDPRRQPGRSSAAHPLLELQRSAGNQAVQSLVRSPFIQAKLQISTPGDPFEEEADRTADTVMRMPEPPSEGIEENEESKSLQAKPLVQRAVPLAVRDDDEEESQIHPVQRSAAAVIQRLCNECEEEKHEDQGQSGTMVHRKSAPEQLPDDEVEEQQVQASRAQIATPKVTTSVASNIHALNGGGSSLPATTRAFFEPRFGADFSQVRVHTDSRAAATASSIQAKAFTVGSNIAFGPGQYAPESHQGRQLLAHELTHVIQQNGSHRLGQPSAMRQASQVATPVQQASTQPVIQRDPVCPNQRDSTEVTKAQSSAGLLAVDTSFNAAKESLSVQDFGIGQDSVRPTMTDSDDWRRMMSMILGDPTAQVAVLGYSDCIGPEQNNRGLRDRRASAVIKAMPAEAQAKVSPLLKGWWGQLTYLFPNDTAENRARNRMVLVALLRAPVDSCDKLAKASNIDEFIFLVTCLEKRLGLTNAADAPKTLSVLRQIFFGNAAWSTQRNRSRIWDDIIPDRPWSPGTDPTPKLGAKLLDALQASKEVKFDSGGASATIEVSHLLTGLDAMMNPQNTAIQVSQKFGGIYLLTNVENHALATWAGDVASAATNYTLCVDFVKYSASYDDFFKDMASNADLEGDIDAYAVWAAMNSAPNAPIPLQMNLPMSEVLMQYYRLKKGPRGQARTERYEVFANFYGAKVQGKKMQDRNAFKQNIHASVEELALLLFFKQFKEVLQGNGASLGNCAGGKPPVQTGQPADVDFDSLIASVRKGSNEMTERFTAWVEQRL